MNLDNLRLIDSEELATLRLRPALSATRVVSEELESFARKNRVTAFQNVAYDSGRHAFAALYQGRASAFAWAAALVLDKAGEREEAAALRVASASDYKAACDAMARLTDSGAAHDKELRRVTLAHDKELRELRADESAGLAFCRDADAHAAELADATSSAAWARVELAETRAALADSFAELDKARADYGVDVMGERDRANKAERDARNGWTKAEESRAESARLRRICEASAGALRDLAAERDKAREELASATSAFSLALRTAREDSALAFAADVAKASAYGFRLATRDSFRAAFPLLSRRVASSAGAWAFFDAGADDPEAFAIVGDSPAELAREGAGHISDSSD